VLQRKEEDPRELTLNQHLSLAPRYVFAIPSSKHEGPVLYLVPLGTSADYGVPKNPQKSPCSLLTGSGNEERHGAV
jgi:hypothetical protein